MSHSSPVDLVTRGRSAAARLRRVLRRTLLARRRSLAALLAGIAVLGVLRAVSPPPGPTAAVQVARRDLAAGTVIERSDLDLVRVPVALVPDGLADTPVGSVLAAPLRRGEPVTDVRLVGPGLGAGFPDRVLVPVRFPDAAAADLLRPGDVIDVLATGSRSAAPGIVAADATVAAVPADRSGQGLAGSAPLGSAASGRLLLLAVHPEDAVDVAVSQVGQLLTYLRND